MPFSLLMMGSVSYLHENFKRRGCSYGIVSHILRTEYFIQNR
eukprot:UN16394